VLYRDRGGLQEFTAQDGTPAAFTSVATLDVILQGPSPDFLFILENSPTLATAKDACCCKQGIRRGHCCQQRYG
jgi:hypothetical protein